jgi:hypothetical protein
MPNWRHSADTDGTSGCRFLYLPQPMMAFAFSIPCAGRFQRPLAVMMAFAFPVPCAGRFQRPFAVMMAFAFSVPCAGRFQRPFAVKLRRFFCHAANG